MNNIIPPILKKYENLLLKTEKKYISITTESVAETLGVNQSKLGGIPYWPKDKEFLKINGKMPILIAQINFQEINEIQELNHFPNKGILQFYYNPVNGFPTVESKLLLFTPFTVTRFAMHRNHAFA